MYWNNANECTFCDERPFLEIQFLIPENVLPYVT